MSSNFTYAVFTDVGGRKVNEDAVGVFHNGDNNCCVLCDGLGGHGMGDVASELVVNAFGTLFGEADNINSFLEKSFTAAQDMLMAEQKNRNADRKMKTTCVAMVTDKHNVHIGHIGDSRCYVFCKNKIKARTLDHSIPQMLVLSKEIKESQIRNHPDRNTLLRVMGVEWDETKYELSNPIPLKKCQALLLCSDGFWELIEENDMCESLRKSGSVQEWLNSMVETVRLHGKAENMDNYSAIAVWNR